MLLDDALRGAIKMYQFSLIALLEYISSRADRLIKFHFIPGTMGKL